MVGVPLRNKKGMLESFKHDFQYEVRVSKDPQLQWNGIDFQIWKAFKKPKKSMKLEV